MSPTRSGQRSSVVWQALSPPFLAAPKRAVDDCRGPHVAHSDSGTGPFGSSRAAPGSPPLHSLPAPAPRWETGRHMLLQPWHACFTVCQSGLALASRRAALAAARARQVRRRQQRSRPPPLLSKQPLLFMQGSVAAMGVADLIPALDAQVGQLSARFCRFFAGLLQAVPPEFLQPATGTRARASTAWQVRSCCCRGWSSRPQSTTFQHMGGIHCTLCTVEALRTMFA